MSSLLRFRCVELASSRKAVPVSIPHERPEAYFASKVFDRRRMFEYLPKETYEALVKAPSLNVIHSALV